MKALQFERSLPRYAAARVAPEWASLRFVQLASRRAVRDFLAAVEPPPS